MMEVDVSRTDRFSPANVLRCAAHVAPLCAQERAGAGEQAPTILGVLAQVALDQGRGFGVLTKMQQRPGDVIVPKGRVLVRWDLSKDAQGVLVFPLMDEGDPDALLSEQVGGVQGQSLLEFGDRVVLESDVVVNHPQLVVRVLQARVKRQRMAVLLDRQKVRESVGGAPQDVRPRVVRFGEIGTEPQRLFPREERALPARCVIRGQSEHPLSVRVRQLGIRRGEPGIQGNRLFEQRDCARQVGRCDPSGPQLAAQVRSEEHTSELQSLAYLVCRLLLEKKKKKKKYEQIDYRCYEDDI